METTIKELKFTSTNGINSIGGRLIVPNIDVKAIVQISHGMSEHINRYTAFMTFLAENGYAVFGNDHIGHGRSSLSEQQLGYLGEKNGYSTMVNDLNKFARIIKSDFPNKPHYLLGHSMGSFLARLYAANYPSQVDDNQLAGLIVVGTGGNNPLLKPALALLNVIIKRKGKLHRPKQIHNMAFGGYNKFFGKDADENAWLSRDTDIVAAYNQDPYSGFIFTAAGFKDLFLLISEANKTQTFANTPKTLPMLIISGDMDPVGDYGKAVKKVYQQYKNTGLKQIELKLYPKARHEILNETNKLEVYQDILNWLDNALPV